MIKSRMMTFRWLLILAVLIVGPLAGCDSVVEPGNHPAGAVFFNANGTEAARFVYQGSAVTGSLPVPLSGTVTYRVRVLTESGDLADFDGVEYGVKSVRVILPAVAGVSLQGDDQIVLNGVTAGETTLRFDLEHGGHTEFEIRDIPVLVQ